MIVKHQLFDPYNSNNTVPFYWDESAPESTRFQLPLSTIFEDSKKRKWLVKVIGYAKKGVFVFGDWKEYTGDDFQYIVADQIETEDFSRYAIERNTMNMLVLEGKLKLLKML